MPRVTIARFNATRKHAMFTGQGNIINEPKIYRMKVTKRKLVHFNDFILNPVYSSIVGQTLGHSLTCESVSKIQKLSQREDNVFITM